MTTVRSSNQGVFLLPENITAGLFILLGFIGISHHEMWLDELHHWLLARDSGSLSELARNARYDVHPLLWNILLFMIAQFTSNPWWMQVLNILLTSVAAFLVLRYAPFPLIMKILVVFGYFFFYEYSIISRNYSLGMLLLFACCVLYRNRTSHYIFLAILLGALANTHLLCLFVSLSFFLALAIDYFVYQTLPIQAKRQALMGLLFYSMCVVIAFLQIAPPADSRIIAMTRHDPSLGGFDNSLSILTEAFLPLPRLDTINWWNTNAIIGYFFFRKDLVPVLILISAFLILWRRSIAAILFFTNAFTTVIFISIFQISSVRYYGFIFLSFIASVWISAYYPAGMNQQRKFSIKKIPRISFIYGILLIQCSAGLIAWVMDFKMPFSQGFNAAEYIRKQHPSTSIIAVSDCDVGVPLSGYLNQKLFYLSFNKAGSFCEWNLSGGKMNSDTLMERCLKLCSSGQPVLLIINSPLTENNLHPITDTISSHSNESIHLLQSFTGSIVKSENYFIYEVLCKK